jgi:monovalent cation/proton antiporter MnhG/PhaG subunit
VSNLAAAILLGVGVLCSWLAVLGALRLRNALDRLHAATFIYAAGLGPVVLAAIAQEGLTDRTLKLVFLFVAMLFAGAAVTHALARAIVTREEADKP